MPTDGGVKFCPACSERYDLVTAPEVCRCGQRLGLANAKSAGKRRSNMNSRDKRYKIGKLIRRDGKVCWICFGSINMKLDGDDPWAVSLDHVVAVADGGDNSLENLKLAHRKCNHERGKGLVPHV